MIDNNQEQFAKEHIETLLRHAKKLGASGVEASSSGSHGLTVSVRHGETEKIEFNRERGIQVIVYFGHQKGAASTTDNSLKSLYKTVEHAVDIALYTEEDSYNGLADSELMAVNLPDLDLSHPWQLQPDDAVSMALVMESTARSVDPRLTNSDGASVSTNSHTFAYGNSHDFLATMSTTTHSLSCVMVGSQDGKMQRDGYYSVARNSDWLESLAQVGQKAGELTRDRLGAHKINTKQMPILFNPECSRTLLGHLIAAISGGNIYRKTSFLQDSLGKQILPKKYSIYEDPYIKGALGSAAFDADGLQTRKQTFVDEGKLGNYVLSAYSARRLGHEPNACAGGVHNLSISNDGLSIQEMLDQVGNGLLVTELMGQGINLLTGDYSRGATGFLIADGKISHPVEEITIAGNLSKMFSDILLVGNDIDTRGNILTGSILVANMTVAGG